MASKRKNPKKTDDKLKKKVIDKMGYIPPDLCEWVSTRNVEDETDVSAVDDEQKKKFLKQMDELKERNEKYSRQTEELNIKLTFYPAKFKKLENDTNDMTTYLNNNLERNEKQCEDKLAVLKKLEEEFQHKKEEHEKKLQAARNAFEDLKSRLLPENTMLKETLHNKSSCQVINFNLEANREEFKKELELKAQQHQTHVYEMEKENVRELFEIREQIPKWVKRVANENMSMETGRMHRILNNYRLELGDLLKRYVGKPNQLARKAIEHNEQLIKTVETNALNIKLILENTEAMKRNGDSDVHEMHDLASNVKENKVLLKSFKSSHELAPDMIQSLKNTVEECKVLVAKAQNAAELSKNEKTQIFSQIEKLDETNYKLQMIIQTYYKVFLKLLVHFPNLEPLLNNLRVASCLEILSEENYETHQCSKPVDPYNIFQTTPIFAPSNNQD